jgi:hypothetical protein
MFFTRTHSRHRVHKIKIHTIVEYLEKDCQLLSSILNVMKPSENTQAGAKRALRGQRQQHAMFSTRPREVDNVLFEKTLGVAFIIQCKHRPS